MDGPLDSIKYLTGVIRSLNVQKGWRENFSGGDTVAPRSGPWFGAYVALAQSELSEALDAYRDKIWSDISAPCEEYDANGSCSHVHKPIGVGPELADSLIRILDMADIWNIDMLYELERVIAYNHTRPFKHGGRVL